MEEDGIEGKKRNGDGMMRGEGIRSDKMVPREEAIEGRRDGMGVGD